MSEHWGGVFDNPKYAGREPTPLEPACHDQTPMIETECPECGAVDHLHESQIARVRPDQQVGLRCSQCRKPMLFGPGVLQAGFAELRRRGWAE